MLPAIIVIYAILVFLSFWYSWVSYTNDVEYEEHGLEWHVVDYDEDGTPYASTMNSRFEASDWAWIFLPPALLAWAGYILFNTPATEPISWWAIGAIVMYFVVETVWIASASNRLRDFLYGALLLLASYGILAFAGNQISAVTNNDWITWPVMLAPAIAIVITGIACYCQWRSDPTIREEDEEYVSCF